MTDAKDMWEAIKSRFGGNDEYKKMQEEPKALVHTLNGEVKTASGKDSQNPLIADSLLNNNMVLNTTIHHKLAIPGQTTTGKESSNPFMAGSLPKTIHFCDSLQSDEDSFNY
ncbi:hypothetical protein Tco_0216769 [Tanacetum coccineum]